ncbi:BPSS1780 family membrane protein [Aquabacterium sp. A7-Y]|uniref:BPSS1780 family membrane protein n=1 Tax=Aquabacterium sp. A7-Y TaxID=1349605 RepID=UPI00223E896C|nr:BPSS1780 family membrane protein [Aquabacterium sp. A7-Y]MCW7536366.1 BPSS1780 family membrane protein [Aquabacterium sp. A7-Y]
MKLRLVRARRGTLWVQQAFRVFFRQPLAFTALLFIALFAAFLLLVLPLVGPLALLTLLPAGTLGFMIATHQAENGERFPMPGVFIAPFRVSRANAKALIQLGVAYALASLFLMLVLQWLEGDSTALQQAMERGQVGGEVLADPAFQRSLLLRALLALPLSLMFWHAPALVHWGGVSAVKSVFFSVVACWRNKGAFVVYAITWAGVLALFGLLSSLVFSLLSAPQLVPLAAYPAALMFMTVFYISLYFTFRDCFELELPDDNNTST